MISVPQIRAARALLGWSQDDLAKKSGLSEMAIKNLERGAVDPRVSTMTNVIQAFEHAGIEFLNSEGTGLRTRSAAALALHNTASYLRKLPKNSFVRDGAAMWSEAEKHLRQQKLDELIVELEHLASLSLRDNVEYSKFEVILSALHKLSVFPTDNLISDVTKALLSSFRTGVHVRFKRGTSLGASFNLEKDAIGKITRERPELKLGSIERVDVQFSGVLIPGVETTLLEIA